MKLKWYEIVFGFTGRISRKVFWLGGLSVVAGFLLLVAAANEIEHAQPSLEAVGQALFVVAVCVTVWCGISLSVKRLHDLDRSGWWLLVRFIPIIGPFWGLVQSVQMGFSGGTEGANRFGPAADFY